MICNQFAMLAALSISGLWTIPVAAVTVDVDSKPRFELRLSSPEYGVLHSAIVGGLLQYGGDAEFTLRAEVVALSASARPDLIWTMTISNPKLLDAMQVWTAERTVALVSLINVDDLDDQSKGVVKVVQSVNTKLAQSKANPVWISRTFPASVIEQNGALVINAGDRVFQVVGEKSSAIKSQVGHNIVVTGFIKNSKSIEVTSFVPRRDNTLELVVMSRCPFGTRAVETVLDFLDHRNETVVSPRLELRYLFYKRDITGADGKSKEEFWCLHGPDELQENLVQIAIRDNCPDRFLYYVRGRLKDKSADWKTVASSSGMTIDEIKVVSDQIALNSENMLRQEFDYVSKTLGVIDGSPTYVWESERVQDINTVPVLKGIKSSADGLCASSGG